MSDRPTPELAAFCATQSPGLRSMDSFSSRAAVGGLMPSMATWRGSASGSANRPAAGGTRRPPPPKPASGAHPRSPALRRAAPGLLQAATRRETSEIDRREAETLDQLFDECGRFGMVPGDEDHATSSVLNRPFIEAGGDDRIERLDDAGTWRQGRYDLARALAAEIGEDELRTRLDKGIRRIDEHPAVPGG